MLLLTSSPAFAASDPPPPGGIPGYTPTAPMKPGRADLSRPMTATPEKNEALPVRERYVAEARQKLEEWDERIRRVKQQANETGDRDTLVAASEAQDAWTVAKQKWQGMEVTRGGNWERMRDDFELAMKDLEKAWAEVRAGG